MSQNAVTHINLLQRHTVQRPMAWMLAAMLVATLTGLTMHGSKLRTVAAKAAAERDTVARQVKEVQAAISTRTGEQAKSADALALRKQIDQMQPAALAAQGLVDALKRVDDGRAESFSRALTICTGIVEPDLWLTAVTISGGGSKLELAGQAANGAAVLRYARRLNDALKPLSLQLNSLDMTPVGGTGVPASGAAPGGAVTFRMS